MIFGCSNVSNQPATFRGFQLDPRSNLQNLVTCPSLLIKHYYGTNTAPIHQGLLAHLQPPTILISSHRIDNGSKTLLYHPKSTHASSVSWSSTHRHSLHAICAPDPRLRPYRSRLRLDIALRDRRSMDGSCRREIPKQGQTVRPRGI